MLGISYEAYWDLESFDEEIVDALSFAQLIKLAGAIELDLRRFFDADDFEHVTFAELAERIRSRVVGPAALASFEDDVGWELGAQLGDPSSFAELPAIALADIGAPLEVDWRSLLPPRSAGRSGPIA